jgi:hypothetical protein
VRFLDGPPEAPSAYAPRVSEGVVGLLRGLSGAGAMGLGAVVWSHGVLTPGLGLSGAMGLVLAWAAVSPGGWASLRRLPLLVASEEGLAVPHPMAGVREVGPGAAATNAERARWVFLPWAELGRLWKGEYQLSGQRVRQALFVEVSAAPHQLPGFDLVPAPTAWSCA